MGVELVNGQVRIFFWVTQVRECLICCFGMKYNDTPIFSHTEAFWNSNLTSESWFNIKQSHYRDSNILLNLIFPGNGQGRQADILI